MTLSERNQADIADFADFKKRNRYARQCKPTEYAESQGALIYDGYCRYWLQMSGTQRYVSTIISFYGQVAETYIDCAYNTVRPVICVELDKLP